MNHEKKEQTIDDKLELLAEGINQIKDRLDLSETVLIRLTMQLEASEQLDFDALLDTLRVCFANIRPSVKRLFEEWIATCESLRLPRELPRKH